MRLTLAPIPWFWPRQRVFEFYAEAAGWPLDVIYLGETMHVLVDIAEGEAITVALRNEGQLIKPLPWRPGEAVAVGWLPEDCQLLEEK